MRTWLGCGRSNDIVLAFAWNDEIEELYRSWQRDVAAAQRVHEAIGERLRTRHAIVGSLLVAACALAAAGAFAPFAVDPGTIAEAGSDRDELLLIVGSGASVATVLAIALMILRYPAAAERHRVAALRYASLDRDIEATLALPREARADPDGVLADSRERMDRYAKASPAMTRRLRRRLERSPSRPVTSLVREPVRA